MRAKRKKREFSKVIITVAGIINIAVILFSCVMIAVTRDTSALCYLIPATAGEVATGTAFYYGKAKAENLVKLKRNNADIDLREVIL